MMMGLNVVESECHYVRMLICPNVDKSCYIRSGDVIYGDKQGYDRLRSRLISRPGEARGCSTNTFVIN